jgi:hypothetical protein
MYSNVFSFLNLEANLQIPNIGIYLKHNCSLFENGFCHDTRGLWHSNIGWYSLCASVALTSSLALARCSQLSGGDDLARGSTMYLYCIWCKKIQFSLKNCQSSKKYSIKWHPKRLPTYTMKVCQICAKLRYNG